jgi:two-component system sensor histidine kinase/response regulator
LRLVAEETENAAEVLEIASTIQTSAQRLHRLIQNFLLYTKLEVAARDPQYTSSLSREITWDPMSIITTLATEMAEREKRSADLGLNLQNAAIAMPYFDLEKVLMELLDNAFKFSWPHTPVTIVSQVKADDYEIHITNHGRGMSVEEIATLGGYMQFNRQTYEQQGVGLGLAIAQRLLELHHGQLTITSIPDQITTISIQLPLATQPVEELELEDGA